MLSRHARDALMLGIGALIQPLIAVGAWVLWQINTHSSKKEGLR